jgi:hypothetical protein
MKPIKLELGKKYVCLGNTNVDDLFTLGKGYTVAKNANGEPAIRDDRGVMMSEKMINYYMQGTGFFLKFELLHNEEEYKMTKEEILKTISYAKGSFDTPEEVLAYFLGTLKDK